MTVGRETDRQDASEFRCLIILVDHDDSQANPE